jgi:hypothetical protein
MGGIAFSTLMSMRTIGNAGINNEQLRAIALRVDQSVIGEECGRPIRRAGLS